MRLSEPRSSTSCKRHDGGVGDGRQRRANEVPGDVRAIPAEVLAHALLLVRGRGREPAAGGVVVVRTRVHDAVRIAVAVRQVRIMGVAAKSELQHLHPGITGRAQQCAYLVGDHAQVLGDDRHGSAERGVDGAEHLLARPRLPVALDRAGSVRRHLPGGVEAAEVVDPDQVDPLQQASETLDPPAEAVSGDHLPVVERIAPELAGGAEIVGRDAGHEARRPVRLELEERPMRPDIHAIVGDEDRDVADQADAPLAGQRCGCLPIARRRRTG